MDSESEESNSGENIRRNRDIRNFKLGDREVAPAVDISSECKPMTIEIKRPLAEYGASGSSKNKGRSKDPRSWIDDNDGKGSHDGSKGKGHSPYRSGSPGVAPHRTLQPLRHRRNSQDTVVSSKTRSTFMSKISTPARKLQRFVTKTMSKWTPFKVMDTEQCPICYDNMHVHSCVKLESCKYHYFCADCITHFFKGRVAEGRVRELRCPLYGEYGCNAVATVEELESLLDEDVMRKYHRFLAQQNDPSLRECPKCLILVAPQVSPDGLDDLVPEMMCKRRCITFCYYHSLQHVGRTCDEFARDEAKMIRMNEKFLQGGGKQCPMCGILTEKNAGCNQMTCGACHRNWCWICEEDIQGRHGWHYNPINPVACLQFDDSLDATPEGHRGWLMIGLKICALPAMLAATALFIAACASTFLFPVFFLPLLVLCAVWFPFAMCIFFCCVPLGAGERHLHFLMGVPFTTFMAEMEMLNNLLTGGTRELDADNDVETQRIP
eukprot:GEMP01009884.1.p1 GENE.GEMP01009884.1~~GEMP01009884.1.p1  ORF type:complete len:494 (+),score=70.14 GEMP01009884.1:263-1744(+)